jgi:hypothetical protein
MAADAYCVDPELRLVSLQIYNDAMAEMQKKPTCYPAEPRRTES